VLKCYSFSIALACLPWYSLRLMAVHSPYPDGGTYPVTLESINQSSEHLRALGNLNTGDIPDARALAEHIRGVGVAIGDIAVRLGEFAEDVPHDMPLSFPRPWHRYLLAAPKGTHVEARPANRGQGARIVHTDATRIIHEVTVPTDYMLGLWASGRDPATKLPMRRCSMTMAPEPCTGRSAGSSNMMAQ